MRIDILTLFPEMFEPLKSSIIGRALDNNCFELNLINIRDFSLDKHHNVDDTPFGGGNGMLMMCQPIYDAIQSVKTENSLVIYMSPKGKTLNQNLVKEYAKFEHLIILCGHYEGVDQRVLDIFGFEELSIGDYVLTGGELPAMVVIDSILRFVPGVLGSEESTGEESFSSGLLEHKQYTRPQDFMGYKVPDVLVSGDHKKVDDWKKENALNETMEKRPDLLNKK